MRTSTTKTLTKLRELRQQEASDINAESNKNEPETWYTEKNRLSLIQIQTPTHIDIEYYLTDDQINTKLTYAILLTFIILIAGVFA